MAGYGWDEYDVRTGGRQSIHDAGNKIDITIEFVKMLDSEAKGGGWAARVKGTPREDAIDDLRTAVVFYAGLEGEGDFRVASPPDPLGQQGIVTLEGTTSELGDFKLDIISDSPYNRVPIHGHPSWTSKPLDRAIVSSMQVPPEAIWQAKNVMFANMKQQADGYIEKYGEDSLPPAWQLFTISNNIQDGNLHMLQKVYSGAFEFELVYSALDASSPSRQEVSAAIERSSKAFKSKFAEKIAPRAPFTDSRYATFAQSMFSNLVGGIGYFHGDFLVDRSYAAEFDEENEGFWEETAEARSRAQVEREGPIELFTSVPSRPFFPRGFLWDEGFHLIPIVEWDVDLTLEIVRSWLSLMDEDGWIAREQILGPEARSKVPPEFQVQYPHYANPPTLFLIVSTMIQNLDANKYSSSHAAELKEQIRAIYPLLKRHHDWFRKTQWGDLRSYDREATSMKEGYRWRGRTPRHILPSGLDDYPRAQPPHPGELHTDLISWTGMVARSLRGAAELLGEAEDASELAEQERAIIQNIDDLHWSSSSNTFCDATIDEYEESVHVCHKGYISIFPFLTGLLPANSPRLKAILDLIGDPEELWSDYGIRSLSRKDEAYGTDENYWKSPIWININYLIVKNLLVSCSIALRLISASSNPNFLSQVVPLSHKSSLQINPPFSSMIQFSLYISAALQRLTSSSSLLFQKLPDHIPNYTSLLIPSPPTSAHSLHATPAQLSQYHLRRMEAHRVRLGAIRSRNGPGTANATFHRLDESCGGDYEDA